MSTTSTKPIIFISYAHADEPDKPAEGEVRWLSFVLRFLQPAVKDGVFDIWVDRQMIGGVDWGPEIEQKLRDCDIFILLVSASSMASNYIVDKEISIVRERQEENGDNVYFYPLLLTPTPDAGLNKVEDKNLRPRDAKPFSGFLLHDRMQHMAEAANEIAKIAHQIAERKGTRQPHVSASRPAHILISGLPETAYERLVGREAELKLLDEAWIEAKTNIISLVAEGGAGKSALVNEWLQRLQMQDYCGAVAVLGWSFYSQGSKKRATAAEEFLNWALRKLDIELETTSASAKGEAIAEALMRRRILLVLDGVEPLQHGPDTQFGQLKDQGVRALLRRFAATPPAQPHGLIVLTSRIAVKDIARWREGVAPVVDVERLSDAAGAALLRDNGVWGTDKELNAAARDFGGHPLALGLLASFIKETQAGDVRRRDHIRGYLADTEIPGHDHARRIMESYKNEWLDGQPILLAIMCMVGLFDRPASRKCLFALRKPPIIEGLTDHIVNLDEKKWQRAIARLRDIRLLSPKDSFAPDELDAHPLVREWFGELLEKSNPKAGRSAHQRVYSYLRDTTKEGKRPTLEALSPLYQAIAHGCRAGQYLKALQEIFVARIARVTPEGFEFYSTKKLGAAGSDLAAMAWFFEAPYENLVAALGGRPGMFVLGQAAYGLRAQGRLAESMPADRALLQSSETASDWFNCAIAASNISATELLLGDVASAISTGSRAVEFGDRTGDSSQPIVRRAFFSEVLHASGRRADAEQLLIEAEKRQRNWQPEYPMLYSVQGYHYCDLLLAMGQWDTVRDRARQALDWGKQEHVILGTGLGLLALGRALFGGALARVHSGHPILARNDVSDAGAQLDAAIDNLRAAGTLHHIPRGLLARAAFRRSIGDWHGAERDIDEIEEIAEPCPMRLFLCDIALERARLAFARTAAFAPLNGMLIESPSKPIASEATETARFAVEAQINLKEARKLMIDCGYHRRAEELAELEAVLSGSCRFASLPPRA